MERRGETLADSQIRPEPNRSILTGRHTLGRHEAPSNSTHAHGPSSSNNKSTAPAQTPKVAQPRLPSKRRARSFTSRLFILPQTPTSATPRNFCCSLQPIATPAISLALSVNATFERCKTKAHTTGGTETKKITQLISDATAVADGSDHWQARCRHTRYVCLSRRFVLYRHQPSSPQRSARSHPRHLVFGRVRCDTEPNKERPKKHGRPTGPAGARSVRDEDEPYRPPQRPADAAAGARGRARFFCSEEKHANDMGIHPSAPNASTRKRRPQKERQRGGGGERGHTVKINAVGVVRRYSPCNDNERPP